MIDSVDVDLKECNEDAKMRLNNIINFLLVKDDDGEDREN